MKKTTFERARPRAELRVADLLRQQPRIASRLMNVKVPSKLFQAIEEIASGLGASKTDVVVALLNAGLDTARERFPRERFPRER